uniref:LNR domain-containing protein n=1 Tax=Pseudictyota dubia TaxID=2749911 RepID=A0A7R9VCJ2_9STRA
MEAGVTKVEVKALPRKTHSKDGMKKVPELHHGGRPPDGEAGPNLTFFPSPSTPAGGVRSDHHGKVHQKKLEESKSGPLPYATTIVATAGVDAPVPCKAGPRPEVVAAHEPPPLPRSFRHDPPPRLPLDVSDLAAQQHQQLQTHQRGSAAAAIHPAQLTSEMAEAAAGVAADNEDNRADDETGTVEIVSARLVSDEEQYDGDEAAAVPLAVATRPGAVSIDLKDRRVRACLAVAAVVIGGALAAGIAVGVTRRSDGNGDTRGFVGTTEKPAETSPTDSPTPTTPTTPAAPAAPASPTPEPTPGPTYLDWVPVGQAIEGDDFSRLGWSVSLSSNGMRLAAAAPSDPVIQETLKSIGATDGATGSAQVCDLSAAQGDDNEGPRTWKCEEISPPRGEEKILATLVSLSGDGERVVVGYPRTTDSTRGFVQAYHHDPSRKSGERWTELGPPIYGNLSDSRWGGTYQWYDTDAVEYEFHHDDAPQPVTSVALSSDGGTVAIGSPKDLAGGLPEVRIFRYDNDTSSWEPLGDPLMGSSANDLFGQTVSMSVDGNIVAVGAPNYENHQASDLDFLEAGSAAVYRYDGKKNAWIKMGQSLEGFSLSDNPGNAELAFFGDSVSLSGDGSVVAVAASYRSSNDGECEGFVKVYMYSEEQDEWTQHGQLLWQNGGLGNATDCRDILETEDNDSGYALSLSGDASRLAVGISSASRYALFSGEVHVFDFDGISWVQTGSIVAGQSEETYSGWAIALSEDGSHLAIGSPLDKEGGSNEKGVIQVYQFGGIAETLAPTVAPCAEDEMEVIFELTTDVLGEETTWRIVDREFSVVGRGGPYGQGFIQTDSFRKCLTVDCYKFSIMDAWDDGIGVRGGYLVSVNGQELPTSNDFEGRADIIIGNCSDPADAFPNYCADADEPKRVGDGMCDIEYNTEECGYDAGDCIDFNTRYPDCEVDSLDGFGDGYCDVAFNSIECGYDGGDCSDFNLAYPNCTVDYPGDIGDGNCDGGIYNTVECGYDGGDCLDFNAGYPDCEVDYPDDIGDGDCEADYNTIECGYDGDDCAAFNLAYPDCEVNFPYLIGDGNCDGGIYNSVECGWDGGDCDEFNKKWPGCSVENPGFIGDDFCDGDDYNTAECGFDGGDCT